MIKSRFYCNKCRVRYEAEIVYDKRVGANVYVYNGMEADTHLPECPSCHAHIKSFKIVRDVPDRYIDDNGNLCIRKYEEI